MNKELKKEYHERNIRWSQTTISQLSFFNILLLSLGVGFLTFSFNPELFKTLNISFNQIDWSVSFLIVSICSIAFSIVLGLITSIARLKNFRITRSINHIRQRTYEHSAKLLDESTPEKYDRIKRTFIILKKIPELTIEECKDYKNVGDFDSRFRELRNISHNLGLNSWSYTKKQSILFGVSITSYLCSIFI